MTPLVLALLVAVAPPQVVVSVDRPFLPGQPAVVRVELAGSHALDVRLYRLRSPERALRDAPAGPSDLAPGKAQTGTPPPGVLLGRTLRQLRHELRTGLDSVLSREGQQAEQALVPAGPPPSPELPLLRGEELLRRWALPCGGDEPHAYCDVDLGPLPSGVYLVEGTSGLAASRAVVLVSRLALVAQRLPGALAVLAADGSTGEGLAQVALTADLGPGQAPLHAVTGKDGTATLKPPGRPLSIVAHAGDDWAVLAVPGAAQAAPRTRAWLGPARGEVAPGELLPLAALQRPPPLQAREVSLTLEDGRGTAVAHGIAHQDEKGLLTGELRVPAEAAEGLGHLVVELDGQPIQGEVWIRRAARPELLATATLDEGREGLRGVVVARDAAGAPVAGAQVEWRLLRTSLAPPGGLPGAEEAPLTEEVAEGQQAADAQGEATLALGRAEPELARYELEVAAVDGWGRRAGARAEKVRGTGPLRVTLTAERRVVVPPERARLTLTVQDAQGRPCAADLQLLLRSVQVGPAGEAQPSALPPLALSVPATGTLEVTVPVLPPGYAEVEARQPPTKAGKPPKLAEAVLFITQKGGDVPFTPDALSLVADRARYAPGDTARVLIFAPFEAGAVLLTPEGAEGGKPEVVEIRESSALVTFKVGAGPALHLAADAVFAGQAHHTQRTWAVAPALEPLLLTATLEPSGKPGLLDLKVHARDGQGRPLAGVSLAVLARDAAAEPSLAPPLAALLAPPTRPEARSAASVLFRSAGASRAQPQVDLEGGVGEGFTPQKGLPARSVRPPHGTLALAERLGPTDRAGLAHLLLPAPLGRAVAATVLGAWTGPQGQSFAQVEVSGDPGGPRLLDLWLPHALRPGDRALAAVSLAGTGEVRLDGAAAPTLLSGPATLTAALDSGHARLKTSGALALDVAAPVRSGEEWLSERVVEVNPRAPLGWEGGSEGTLRLRASSGPLGMVRGLTAAPEPPAPSPWEGDVGAPAPAGVDEALARLATQLAQPGQDEGALAGPVAAVVARLGPDGRLGPALAPFDRSRTAVALWLLVEAQARGAAVPPSWLDRVRARLAVRPGSNGSVGAGLTALATDAPGPAMDPADVARAPAEAAAWALWAARSHPVTADALALALEQAAGTAGGAADGRACWDDGGCAPDRAATASSLSATALAVQALALIKPGSSRLGPGLRYLLMARDQAPWGRGLSGALLPLALAASAAAEPGARLLLSAPGAAAQAVQLPPGGSGVWTVMRGPVQLVARSGSAWVELAHARAEPLEADGVLTVTRRYLHVRRPMGAPPALTAVAGPLRLGDEVWVELTVEHAPAGETVELVDRLPGGLYAAEQPAPLGPEAELVGHGGAIEARGEAVRLRLPPGVRKAAYLARARVAGHAVAPPARAEAGAFRGQSKSDTLDIDAP